MYGVHVGWNLGKWELVNRHSNHFEMGSLNMRKHYDSLVKVKDRHKGYELHTINAKDMHHLFSILSDLFPA